MKTYNEIINSENNRIMSLSELGHCYDIGRIINTSKILDTTIDIFNRYVNIYFMNGHINYNNELGYNKNIFNGIYMYNLINTGMGTSIDTSSFNDIMNNLRGIEYIDYIGKIKTIIRPKTQESTINVRNNVVDKRKNDDRTLEIINNENNKNIDNIVNKKQKIESMTQDDTEVLSTANINTGNTGDSGDSGDSGNFVWINKKINT